jgi:ribosomal protein S18 acetylase RimI-like enzyme
LESIQKIIENTKTLHNKEGYMEIIKILEDKEKFMDLLLLADEQEDMIYKYLHRGELFALYDGDLKTVSVITKEGENIYEIKNIATYEKYQGKGFGEKMIQYIIQDIRNKCDTLLVGTGESNKTISFYKKCGFEFSHIVKDFFINNYDHKIFEEGKQLKDMIYLKMVFRVHNVDTLWTDSNL